MPTQQKTLGRVLWELAPSATDAIVDILQSEECLGCARLACKALRSTIDSSIRSATFTIGAPQVELWRAGHLSPLSCFPRCNSVSITVCDPEETDVDVATLMALPFMGQPLAARQRITSLQEFSISFKDTEQDVIIIPEGHLMTSLAVLLPSLRVVDMKGLDVPCVPEWIIHGEIEVPYDPMQRRLMYDALGGLPYLERLSVPYCPNFEHVGQLAGTLRYLCVYTYMSCDVFTEAAVAGIMQLRRLEHLRIDNRPIDYDGMLPEDVRGGGIGLLLEDVGTLAGSLERLEVEVPSDMMHNYRYLTPAAIASIAQLRRLRHLSLKPCSFREEELEVGAASSGGVPQLLACLPPALEELALGLEVSGRYQQAAGRDVSAVFTVHFGHGDSSRSSRCTGITFAKMGYVARGADFALYLRLLSSCCRPCQRGLGRVHIPTLVLLPDLGKPVGTDQWHLQQLREALQARRRAGAEVAMEVGNLMVGDAQLALAAVGALGKTQELALWVGNNMGHERSLALRGPAQPQLPLLPPLRQCEGEGAGLVVAGPQLPLRQPQLPLPAVADVARSVMQRLTARVAESGCLLLKGSFVRGLLGLPAEFLGSFLRTLQKQVPGLEKYQLLPAAAAAAVGGALLVQAGWRAGDMEAAVGAIRELAERLPPGALQVEPVKCTSSACPTSCFLAALEQELQALWDDQAARRREGEREWLRRVLELWDQLGRLPPAVYLTTEAGN